MTRDALRQIRGGHPWVFADSITSTSHEGAPGDLAVVFDDRRRFAAIGLWDPASPIRVRVLHQGSPTPIDAAFWAERLASAHERRRALVDDPATTAWRWVHGENDGFPGLVLDRYDTTVVAKVYSAAWLPHLHDVVEAALAHGPVESVVARFGRSVAAAADHVGLAEGTALAGTAPDAPVRFRENNLSFDADLVAGHKTGHFLDQRDNRARVRALADGARVLDVFCCTGGFSVHAAAGGARSVLAVDASAPAVSAAGRNLELNRGEVDARFELTTAVGDAFEVLDALGRGRERFDLAVVDPPSFTRRAGDADAAVRAYRKLTTLAVACVERGGVLVQSSCSSRVDADAFHATVHGAAEAAGRSLTDIERTGHALDHPVGFPQGAYLKTLFASVR